MANNLFMSTIIIRSIIIYFIILLVFRLMGKRQLGQMQPFELVLTLILADLGTIPMAEVSVPLLHGIVPLITLVLVHYLLTIITKLSPKVGTILSGKPIIVIDENGINYKALQKLNITIDDLCESLRSLGYFSFDDILYAIMETNGKLSVMPKISTTPATLTDLNITRPETPFPVTIISDGKFVEDNIISLKVNKQNVIDFLNKKQLSIKKILILTYCTNGNVYYQEKNKKYNTCNVQWKSEMSK